MIKDIVRDILFLQRKAEPATRNDWQVGRDLVDTLESKLDTCAGLAANMIGSTKAVILFRQGNKSVVMYNPEILKTSPAPYDAEEGCLSLDGRRPCKRYDKIEVKFMDSLFRKKTKTFTGFTAEVIQHEIDHLHGILI